MPGMPECSPPRRPYQLQLMGKGGFPRSAGRISRDRFQTFRLLPDFRHSAVARALQIGLTVAAASSLDTVPSLPTPGASSPAPGDLDPQTVTLDLLRRYDRPGPRYTSYPTAVEFHEGFGPTAYAERLAAASATPDAPLSLYLHLPFCESRCAFCGCSVIVTRKRHVAEQYLGYLVREIRMVAEALQGRRHVVQYHWGGGTPSYLSSDQMRSLHEEVRRHFDIDASGELALEVDPRVTSFEQLETLRALGFNRLSLGRAGLRPRRAAGRRVASRASTPRVRSSSMRAPWGSARSMST